jgi:hypothetical protein
LTAALSSSVACAYGEGWAFVHRGLEDGRKDVSIRSPHRLHTVSIRRLSLRVVLSANMPVNWPPLREYREAICHDGMVLALGTMLGRILITWLVRVTLT